MPYDLIAQTRTAQRQYSWKTKEHTAAKCMERVLSATATPPQCVPTLVFSTRCAAQLARTRRWQMCIDFRSWLGFPPPWSMVWPIACASKHVACEDYISCWRNTLSSIIDLGLCVPTWTSMTLCKLICQPGCARCTSSWNLLAAAQICKILTARAPPKSSWLVSAMARSPCLLHCSIKRCSPFMAFITQTSSPLFRLWCRYYIWTFWKASDCSILLL